jgi:eukaryotic-like serine/threonine-protein kinase
MALSEAGAMARLHHPAVLPVLDFGTLPESTSAGLGAPYAVGLPWIAMDWAADGSLHRRIPLRFEELAPLLLALLGGLAHAHARGVLHRDLKPGNVLLSRGRVMLADFGLAYDQVDGTPVHGGTPWYMAPEQLSREMRLWGPWTDLFGLGRLAWRMLAHRQVCDETSFNGLLSRDPSLPKAAWTWLQGLMAADLNRRYPSAADAAQALTDVMEGRSVSVPRLPPDGLRTRLPTAGFRGAAPVPSVWDHRGRGVALSLAPGLGLFPFRAVPFVGRSVERTQLWDLFRRTATRRRCGMAVLQGPAGIGKTRLAQWLGEHVEELGLGAAVCVGPDRVHSGGDPVQSMLARLLGIERLTEEEAADSLQDWADEVIPIALLRALVHGPGSENRSEPDQHTRLAAAVHLLSRIAGDRTVVLCVDDADRWAEGLELASTVLRSPKRVPVVVLLTLRELPVAGKRADQMDDLLSAPGTELLELGPLVEEDTWNLITTGLGLCGTEAAMLADRTAGNPMFAIGWVSSLVRQGALLPHRNGYVLAEGATLEVPSSLLDLWRRRLAYTLCLEAPDAVVAVEVAAALGQRVDPLLWAEAAGRLGVAVDGLDRVLVGAGLWVEDADGLAFAHALVRAAVPTRPAVHRACADALLGHGEAHSEAVGRHMARAGDPAGAAPLLLQAAKDSVAKGRAAHTVVLLEEHRAALEAVGEPEGSAAWIHAWMVACSVRTTWGDFDGTMGLARRAMEAANALDDPLLQAQTLALLAVFVSRSGRPEEASKLWAEAAARAEGQPGADEVRAGFFTEAAWDCLFVLNRPGQAEVLLSRALSLARAHKTRVRAHLWLAEVARRRDGDHQRAVDTFRRLLVEIQPYVRLRCLVHQLLSAAYTQLGRLGEAEREINAGLRVARAFGFNDVVVLQLYLGTAIVRQGRAAEALRVFEIAEVDAQHFGEKLNAHCAVVGQMVSCASMGDWAAFDGQIARAEQAAATAMFAHTEVLRMVEFAAKEAEKQGEPLRAIRVRALRTAIMAFKGRPRP